MNWHWDDKTMHRVIGAGVWVIIAAIVMPGLMKRADKVVELTELKRVALPPKPKIAEIKISKEVQEFKSQSLAQVNLSQELASKAEVVAQKTNTIKVVAAIPSKPKTVQVQRAQMAIKPAPAPIPVSRPLAKPQGSFAVQLGSFSNKQNADTLILSLKRQGFNVTSKVITLNHAPAYKVWVSGAANRDEAKVLQKRLALTTKINGIIVNTQQG